MTQTIRLPNSIWSWPKRYNDRETKHTYWIGQMNRVSNDKMTSVAWFFLNENNTIAPSAFLWHMRFRSWVCFQMDFNLFNHVTNVKCELCPFFVRYSCYLDGKWIKFMQSTNPIHFLLQLKMMLHATGGPMCKCLYSTKTDELQLPSVDRSIGLIACNSCSIGPIKLMCFRR